MAFKPRNDESKAEALFVGEENIWLPVLANLLRCTTKAISDSNSKATEKAAAGSSVCRTASLRCMGDAAERWSSCVLAGDGAGEEGEWYAEEYVFGGDWTVASTGDFGEETVAPAGGLDDWVFACADIIVSAEEMEDTGSEGKGRECESVAGEAEALGDFAAAVELLTIG